MYAQHTEIFSTSCVGLFTSEFFLHNSLSSKCSLCLLRSAGSDVFSTSSDGQVMWWDIRKMVEPVETLPLKFAGYRAGMMLGGVTLEYESTMVRHACPLILAAA